MRHVDTLVQDVRFALRTLRKTPLFTSVALITLALGIGANTAMFSIVHGVLMTPLPYRDADRLVTILDHGVSPVAPADFLDYQQQSRSFDAMAGAGAWGATLTGLERAEQIQGMQLTSGMFALLGAPALHGRTPTADEFQPGHERVVVLSHRLWQRRFGASVHAVGESITLNGEPYTIVGVMPANFRFSPFWVDAEMWSPLVLAGRSTDRSAQFMRIFARLRPGVSVQQAQAEMDGIAQRLAAAYPENAGKTARVNFLSEKVTGKIRPALLALFGAVGFVLLIACVNVANLALARAAQREKEIAIRRAMGAGWGRIVRQFLTEAVALSLTGGLLGILLANWAVRGARAILAGDANRHAAALPRVDAVALDANVLVFAALLSMLAGIAFGFAPAWHAARQRATDALRERVRGVRVRGALVVAEVALSVVLLAGAGLLLRTFMLLRSVDPGFNVAHLLTMTVSVAGQPDLVGDKREQFYRDAVREVGSLPGVQSTAMVNHLPIGGDTWGSRVYAEGAPLPDPGQETHAVYRVCTPGYFRTMGIRRLGGRDFTDRDTAGSTRVVVVNQKLASRFWPGEDAVGKRLTTGDPRNSRPEWLTVAGVVANVKQESWAGDANEEFYIPFAQDEGFRSVARPPVAYMSLVARTAGEPMTLAKAAQERIWSLNRDVALQQVRSFEDIVASSLWQARVQMLLLTAFAGFAVTLAAIGIYGVIAYSVSRRANEIGIRMALGARPWSVVWMVLRNGFVLTGAGIVIGVAAALAATRSLATMLYGVRTTDPLTFAVVPAVLAAIGLLASYLPARRAAALDPADALRTE